MDDRQLIEDLLSALEYHTEQTRPIEFSKVAIEATREYLRKPAQRTWVGLTDEEIKAFDTWHDNREEEVGWCNPSEIVAYIEAKLRSKNT